VVGNLQERVHMKDLLVDGEDNIKTDLIEDDGLDESGL
jgi:hypothetical protein